MAWVPDNSVPGDTYYPGDGFTGAFPPEYEGTDLELSWFQQFDSIPTGDGPVYLVVGGVETLAETVTGVYSNPMTCYYVLSGWAFGVPVVWRFKYKKSGDETWYYSTEHSFTLVPYIDGVAKPTTPTPTDASGPGLDWTNWTVSWAEGGGTVTAESYNVYAGPSAGSLTLFGSGVTGTTFIFMEGNRPTVTDGLLYWRVDAMAAGYDTTVGDVWSFDARPAKAADPTPDNEATGISLSTPATCSPAAGATSYDLYIAEHGASVVRVAENLSAAGVASITGYLSLGYAKKYDWRLDTRNTFGTTTGDVWQFGTLIEDPPMPSWSLLPGKTAGPVATWDGFTLILPGVEGVDFIWNGINNMRTTRRLVAAANNRIWYEDM
jgi:hypothetical protein